MTTAKYSNRQLYTHTFKRAFLSSLGIALICLLIMILLIPVSTSIVPDYSIFNLDYTHHQMKYRFFYESLRPLVNGMAVLSGITTALMLFRFMLVRRSSDAYFALGVKREKLLILHSIAGIIQLFFVFVIPMLISMIMNIKAFGELGYTHTIIAGFQYMSIGLFTLALVGFGITALVCCMVGTMMEAGLFALIIAAGPSIILYGVNALTKNLLFGNAFGISASTGSQEVSQSLLDKLDFLNPILFFYSTSEHYNTQSERFDGYILPDMQWLRIIGWLIMFVIIMVLAELALKKRKAEISGVSGKSRVFHFIITFLLSFLGFSLVLSFAYPAGMKLAVLAAVAAFLVIYVIAELLQVHSIKKAVWQLPVQLGITVIATVILCTGGVGYSSRVPQLAEIESAKISYVGSPNYLSGQPGGMGDGRQYYISSAYTFTDSSDIDTLIKLHKELIKAGKGKLALSSLDFSSTFVPYDITVSYQLEDGSQITRYYDRTTYQVLEDMLALDDTDMVRTSMQQTITNGDSLYYASGAYKSGTVYLSNSWYTNPRKLSIDSSKRQELLSCIAEDVANQSVEERYFPKEDAVGIIMFSLSGDSDSLQFGYNFDNAVIYLTPEFTNTLQFYKDEGLSYCFNFEDEIESITLQAFNPYVSKVNTMVQPGSAFFMGYTTEYSDEYIQVKDFGKDLELTEPEDINEISGLLQNNYFMSRGGYLACVKIKGKEQYVYKFLPAQDAPDDIKNKIQ